MSEWKEVKLGDIVDINKSTYSIKDKWDYISYLDTGNITKGVIDNIQVYEDIDAIPSRARRKVMKNDIIYSCVRPNQRHYGFISEPIDNLLVSTGFATISTKPEKANAKYLYYFLTQNEIVEYLQNIGEQAVSTYPTIKPSDISNIDIKIPSIQIQSEIAGILSSLDAKIETNNKLNEKLEEMAQAIFKSWFVDFEPFKDMPFHETELGMIPEGWEVVSLDEIATFTNGLAMQKYRPNDNESYLPVLKIKELRQGFCDDTSEICTDNILENYIAEDGDVIFSWSGTLLVDIWCGGKCGVNQHLFKVTSEKYNKWFYYFWIKRHLAEFIRIANDKAVTMGHIKRTHLTNALVVVPNKKLMQKADKIFNPIVNRIIEAKIESKRLASLRDTLLPRLMSGELIV